MSLPVTGLIVIGVLLLAMVVVNTLIDRWAHNHNLWFCVPAILSTLLNAGVWFAAGYAFLWWISRSVK